MAAIALALVVGGCSGDAKDTSNDTGKDAGKDAGKDTATTPPAAASTTAAPGPVRVLDQDFPDPDLLRVGTTYYAYATQPAEGGRNVQLASSKDLRTWQVLDRDPLPTLPTWATAGRTWAPEVTTVPGGFAMYFTAHSVSPDLQCIGVAKSTSPMGPFRPVGSRPLVCPAASGGAIDAASHTEPDGRRFLLWKNDGNCCGKDTWLHLQPLSADGLRFTGAARRLVKQTEPWEGNLVEAPTLIRRGSSYVLFYSANDYSGGKYATGYATASRLEGPYRKAAGPLLTTETHKVTGPGGQDVVTDPAGRPHLVFHGWDDAVVYRAMHLAPLTWRGAVPVVAP